jgi:hypothetical protein
MNVIQSSVFFHEAKILAACKSNVHNWQMWNFFVFQYIKQQPLDSFDQRSAECNAVHTHFK